MGKNIKGFLTSLFIVALCFSLTACAGNTGNNEDEVTGTFSSTDLEGNKVTEKIFGEKDVTILNVWGTYCGPCKKEMPELAKLEEELPDNVQIIGIVLDVLEGDAEMTELAREICEDTNVSYTNIVVNDSMYEMLSGIEAIPTTFILNREGKTICEPIVGADVDAYKNAVMEYLE